MLHNGNEWQQFQHVIVVTAITRRKYTSFRETMATNNTAGKLQLFGGEATDLAPIDSTLLDYPPGCAAMPISTVSQR